MNDNEATPTPPVTPSFGTGSFPVNSTMNGKKLVPGVLIGFVIFTIIATYATYFGGRMWGQALDKKAQKISREAEAERLRARELRSQENGQNNQANP